jgi:hypothetical protein
MVWYIRSLEIKFQTAVLYCQHLQGYKNESPLETIYLNCTNNIRKVADYVKYEEPRAAH